MPPNRPKLNALITRFRESYSSLNLSLEKQQLVEFWQCTNTVSANAIFVFSVLPGRPSSQAQVIWGGIIKRFLIAYFIGSISAKKYQNPFTCVKVIASQRWDVFWDTVYMQICRLPIFIDYVVLSEVFNYFLLGRLYRGYDLVFFLGAINFFFYLSIVIHHKGRRNNETNKQAEKKRKT